MGQESIPQATGGFLAQGFVFRAVDFHPQDLIGALIFFYNGFFCLLREGGNGINLNLHIVQKLRNWVVFDRLDCDRREAIGAFRTDLLDTTNGF